MIPIPVKYVKVVRSEVLPPGRYFIVRGILSAVEVGDLLWCPDGVYLVLCVGSEWKHWQERS